jgi:hypothetical protein
MILMRRVVQTRELTINIDSRIVGGWRDDVPVQRVTCDV